MIEYITVNSKGQVTIPANIRNAIGIHSGQGIECESTADGYLVLRPKKSIFELLKNFKRPNQKKKLSLKQEKLLMMEAVAEHAGRS